MMAACVSRWLSYSKKKKKSLLGLVAVTPKQKNISGHYFKKPHTHRVTFSLLTLSLFVVHRSRRNHHHKQDVYSI